MSARRTARSLRVPLLLAAALAAWHGPLAADDADRPPPEAASGTAGRAGVTLREHMVVAAHPLAAETGAATLAAGGSAVDAMIVTQLVLNLVEPQSSGIGGGGFLLHYDAVARHLAAYDGRETAPAAATPDLFLDGRGSPLRFLDAVIGGRSVGTPGLLRLMEEAHRRHGRLPWARLFAPAIDLAEGGFAVSPRLAALIAGDAERLARHAATRAYFLRPDGTPRQAGETLRNPEFAATLRLIAARGADAFYAGDIARDIVAAVQGAPGNPGRLAEADLAGYRAIVREPVCSVYRRRRVCGMGPPSSGGIAVGQILGLLERFDLAHLSPGSAAAAHLFAEASRLAFADRARYVADGDFVRVPVRGLLDPGYLAARARAIDPARTLGRAEAGEPPWRDGGLHAPDDSSEIPATSHISVVDGDGNVVALTTSIEAGFGSRLMVRGFLLNNQLTDFSFSPEAGGAPVANRVEPGKRPRSSMAPTVVFDGDGRPVLALGSPGGARIIPYVARTLVALIDWGLDPQAAVALPHIANLNGATELEAGTAAAALKPALEALGHEVRVIDMTSGLHVIAIAPGALAGGADPRREGSVAGR